jgi:hypothetical protein
MRDCAFVVLCIICVFDLWLPAFCADCVCLFYHLLCDLLLPCHVFVSIFGLLASVAVVEYLH